MDTTEQQAATTEPEATKDQKQKAGPARAKAKKQEGTLTIGEQTWTIVPATQCSVYPGNVVSIAGHAKKDEKVEIVIDHDEKSKLVQVTLKGPDGSPHWTAKKEALEFEIDGKHVSGKGTFSAGFDAPKDQPKEAEGTFDISC